MSNKHLLLIPILVLILSSVSVSAEQTVKTIEVPINYIAQTTPNINHITTKNIKIPDGVSEIVSLQILLRGDFQASTNILGRVRKTNAQQIFDCNPASWTTPSVDAPDYRLTFDCTDRVKNINFKGGDVDLGIRMDKTAQNVKASMKMTYLNKPSADLNIFGTEYTFDVDDEAMPWVHLITSNKTDNINDAICQIDIYTPDQQQLIEKTSMEFFEDGVYFFKIPVPQQEGVFPVIVECFFGANQNKTFADSFTVVTDWSTLDAGTIGNTQSEDSVTLDIKEVQIGGNPARLNWTLNVSQMCEYNSTTMNGITIHWIGEWKSITNDFGIFSIWNHTSNSWIELPNKITPSGIFQTITNLVETTNLTNAGITNSTNGDVRVKITDTHSVIDNKETKMKVDEFWVSCDEFGVDNINGEWQSVKGSSEIHVMAEKPYISLLVQGNVTNETLFKSFTLEYLVSSVRDGTEVIELDLLDIFPCGHITNISYLNDTLNQVIGLIWNESLSSGDMCKGNFNFNLENEKNYKIFIDIDNVWKLDILSQYSTNYILNDTVVIACENYQETKNLTNFTIPITSATNSHPDDNLYVACERFFTTFQHYDDITNTNFLSIINGNFSLTKDELDEKEAIFTHVIEEGEEVFNLGMAILQNMVFSGVYSRKIINDSIVTSKQNYTTFFANLSTPYLNYLNILNTPNRTWDSSISKNRSLTQAVTTDLTPVLNNLNMANASLHGRFDAVDGNLTSINNTILSVNTTLWDRIGTIPSLVWTYGTRTLTAFSLLVNITQEVYDNIITAVWLNATNRTLTESVTTTVNTTEIARNVWNYSIRNLTDYNQSEDLSAGDVWNYIDRNLTFIPTVNASVQINFTEIGKAVWNSSERNLTAFQFTNVNSSIDPATVWNYFNRTLTSNGLLTAVEVWSFSSRNLTFIPTVNATINNTLLSDEVWSNSNRTLTDYNQTGILTSIDNVPSNVWSSNNRTLTNFDFLVNLTTNTIADIWTNPTRTLTSLGTLLDGIATDVWNYNFGKYTNGVNP